MKKLLASLLGLSLLISITSCTITPVYVGPPAPYAEPAVVVEPGMVWGPTVYYGPAWNGYYWSPRWHRYYRR